LGKWREAWPEYEWRWQTKGFPRFAFGQPRWDGQGNAGTLLVLGEQGLGDTLQFVRYLPLVRKRGWKVIFQPQSPLTRLLGADRAPDFDAYVPLLSLAGVFHTTPDTVPAAVPYLHSDAGLAEYWRGQLRESAKSKVRSAKSEGTALTSHIAHRTSHLLVGIAWQGDPTFRSDRQRSIPLTCFAPLVQVQGVKLISLQKGPGTEQLREMKDVQDLGNRLDEAAGPFMDSVAILQSVDLVVCSDTAVAHLAGALGVPVWLALPVVPDWRWLLQRSDSPWYPSMRLFRQTRRGDWDEVFERMARELKKLTIVNAGH
jgi:hypothetical protein